MTDTLFPQPGASSLASREITRASKAADRGYSMACADLGGRRVRQREEGYGCDGGLRVCVVRACEDSRFGRVIAAELFREKERSVWTWSY